VQYDDQWKLKIGNNDRLDDEIGAWIRCPHHMKQCNARNNRKLTPIEEASKMTKNNLC
jgi:hypothetical protein